MEPDLSRGHHGLARALAVRMRVITDVRDRLGRHDEEPAARHRHYGVPHQPRHGEGHVEPPEPLPRRQMERGRGLLQVLRHPGLGLELGGAESGAVELVAELDDVLAFEPDRASHRRHRQAGAEFEVEVGCILVNMTPEERRVKELEAEIAAKEETIAALEDELADASVRADHQLFVQTAKAHSQRQEELQQLLREWETAATNATSG